MNSQVAKEQKGSLLNRSSSSHSTDQDPLQQYGNAFRNDLYSTSGYGNQIMQAMYGYKQGISLQTPSTGIQKMASSSHQVRGIQQKMASNIPALTSAHTLQKKLEIGSPDDRYEKEAEAVANHVMGMPDPPVQRKCAHCEAQGKLQLKPVISSIQRKTSERGSVASESVSRQIDATKGSGSPLPENTKTFMESRIGADFSQVSIHTGNDAVQLSKDLNAQAFTTGNDIYFNQGKYSPESSQGKHLLAHELTHVVQQNSQAIRKYSIQRSPESDLIDTHTSWGDLNEAALGQQLLARAQSGEYEFVQRVLNELGSTDRDDVAFEMMKAARNDAIIEGFARSEGGRSMLDRLFDELTSGSVDEEEQAQADRIINIKTRVANTPQQLDQAVNSPDIKIFPFRLPGMTVWSDAPITAVRGENRTIVVDIPVRVLGTDMFQQEVRTLRSRFHFVLPENEIVGVKMYDLGGITIYRPALFLVQLSNQTDTRVLQTIVEVAGIALTLGSGSLAVSATTRMGQMLVWADRIAFGVGTISSILREHRGWIISTYGEEGVAFLRYVDMVNSVVAIYGGARALVSMGQLMTNFGRAVINWRRAVSTSSAQLGTTERGVVSQLSQQADDTLTNVEQLQQARAASPQPSAPQTPAPQGDTPGMPRGFTEEGRLARGRSGSRTTLAQEPGAPTCGPVSCGMVIDTAGNQYDLANLVREAGPDGTTLDTMLSILRRHRIDANIRASLTIDEFAAATRSGNPAIALIRTNTPGHTLHYVVIDGVTMRNGARVVAIRNPWGGANSQYFELVEVFERSFIGRGTTQGITINYSY